MILIALSVSVAAVSAFFWRKAVSDLRASEAQFAFAETARVNIYIRKVGYRSYTVHDDASGCIGTGKSPRTALKSWIDARGEFYEFSRYNFCVHGLWATSHMGDKP